MQPPALHDPANAVWAYRPDIARVFEAAKMAARDLAPAAHDRHKVALLVVDAQKDFCLPEGALFVGGRSGRGAVDDSVRMAGFIYRNLDVITTIVPTLDSHHPWHIFSPSFWDDEAGAPLPPYAEVTAEGEGFRFSGNGRNWRPCRPAAAAAQLIGMDAEQVHNQALHYCRTLQREGRYRLVVWPFHCIMGSEGHDLVGIVHEAILFHAFAREAPNRVITKGEHPLSENYSVFSPEVRTWHDGRPYLEKNTALIDWLLDHDRVLIIGQAASHCVKWSIDDLLAEVQARTPGLAGKLAVGVDMMSSVAVPDGHGGFVADFTDDTEQAFGRWRQAGVRLFRSTDDLRTVLDI